VKKAILHEFRKKCLGKDRYKVNADLSKFAAINANWSTEADHTDASVQMISAVIFCRPMPVKSW